MEKYISKKILISLFFILIHADAIWAAGACNENKDELGQFWTRSSRSQIGEWVQFLGKGIANSEEGAIFKAEGQALNNLLKECNFIHAKSKFHERCVESKLGKYFAYTRVSIKRKHCKMNGEINNKLRNKLLTDNYLKYKETYLKYSEFSVNGCSASDVSSCNSLSQFELAKGNTKKAISLLSIGCQNGDSDSCFSLVTTLHRNKKSYINFIKLGCEYSDEIACEKEGQNNLSKGYLEVSFHYFQQSCEKGSDKSCVKLSDKDFNNFRSNTSSEVLKSACNRGLGLSCSELSRIYHTNGKTSLSIKAKSRACQLGVKESCEDKNKKFDKRSLEDEFGEESIQELEI